MQSPLGIAAAHSHSMAFAPQAAWSWKADRIDGPPREPPWPINVLARMASATGDFATVLLPRHFLLSNGCLSRRRAT